MCISDVEGAAVPDSFGMLLGLVRTELVRALEEALAADGIALRFSQFQTLMRLSGLGSMSAGELARSMCYDGGAMTRLLDQLEGRGYLARHRDPQDRRALRIELTASGDALCERMRVCAGNLLDRAQAALDASERAQLTDYLQRIFVTLQQLD